MLQLKIPGARGGRRPLALFVAIACMLGSLLLAAAPANATLQLLKQNPSDPSTFVGHGGYSADGLGQSVAGGTIQTEVPSGSTVVQAYLYGTYYGTDPGMPEAERTINFDGTSVVMTELANSEPGPCCQLLTTRAAVTAQVAAKVGSGGGVTDFVVNSDPVFLDGVALVVLYANPASPDVTVAVLDGGSKQQGDAVTFNFASPLNLAAPGFSAKLSLGSGFSYQGGLPGHACGGVQFSTVTVNGAPLTSCAGNFDDGDAANGALITVGGVGDSLDNPANPLSSTTGTDDELYNLVPFLQSGDTSMVLQTTNPSGDDNLFLAVIEITAAAAVTTEVCDDGIDNDGDGLIDGADPDCVVITPAPDPTVTTYTGGTTVQYSDPLTVSGTLVNTAPTPDAPLAGKSLGFQLGTQSTSAATDAAGTASTSITVMQAPGPYNVVTTFAGDSAFAASSDTDAVTVTKEDCTLSYTGDTIVAPTASTVLSARLGEPDATLGDRSGKIVTFSVTNSSLVLQTFTAVSDANGDASTTQPLGSDVYGVAVSFAGDDHYVACQTSTDTLVTVQQAESKVTGGGWTSIGTGRTSFGFNVIPEAVGFKGQFQLRSSSDKIKFHGNTASGLVVSNNSATWRGTGKWNGADGYTFQAWALDAGSSGANKGDTVKIIIKDPSGAVVFTTGSSPVSLKGGNITVH